jgi:hypothetical protein
MELAGEVGEEVKIQAYFKIYMFELESNRYLKSDFLKSFFAKKLQIITFATL